MIFKFVVMIIKIIVMIIKIIVMIIKVIGMSIKVIIIIIINLDDIPVTHTYLQDSGEESDTPSTLEVLEEN